MVTILIFGFLVSTFSYLLLIYGTNVSKKIRNNNHPSKTPQLFPLPEIGLIKGFGWMFFCGRGSITKFLVHIGKINTIVACKIWKIRFAIINDYELGKELFKNPIFCGKPTNDLFTCHAKGAYGVISPYGKKWKEQRKFCQQHLRDFGFGTKSMEILIQNEIEDLIDSWSSKKGKAFSPNSDFYIPIVSSLWVLLTGKRASAKDEQLVPLVNCVFEGMRKALGFPEIVLGMSPAKLDTVNTLLKWIPFFPGVKAFQDSTTKLRIYLKSIIESRREILDTIETPTNFLDAYLIEIKKTKDPESEFFGDQGELHLIAAMMDFFMAGGDTTAIMLAWAMLHLIRNPDIQQKIQEEVDAAVGTGRRPCLLDRSVCPYTEAFLLELLRFSPIASATMPHTPTEDTNVGPYFIHKETFLFLNIYNIHHDPLIWGDPENFRPERFLSEDGKNVVRHEAMCIFSLGQRRCVGEQVARDNMFLFVSSICQRFILKPDPLLQGLPPLDDQRSAVYVPKTYNMVAIERLKDGHVEP